MKLKVYLFALILLSSCYGVNEETSEIFGLSICCNDKTTWPTIFKEHAVENCDADSVQTILSEFRNQPFPNDVLYFKEGPEEYIGISENRMSVRYVYNKKIADQVLNGLSPKLSDSERIRIGLRVNLLHMNYLNEQGRKESIITIKEECADFLNKKEQ